MSNKPGIGSETFKLKLNKDWFNNRPYFVSYVLNPDKTLIHVVIFVANPAFDEIGLYTLEEANKIVELLQKQKVPKFIKTNTIGDYTYKTYEEWRKFVKSNDKKIKKLINELRSNA